MNTSHKGFAESVGADFISCRAFKFKHKFPGHRLIETLINGLKLPKYDIYLCESIIPVFPAIIKKLMNNRQGKIVVIAADSYLPMTTLGIPEPIKGEFKYSWKLGSGYIDGAIAVSDFMKKEALKILKCPVRVAHPFVKDEIFGKLLSVKPNLNTHNILFVGENHPRTGIDILVDAFKIVKEELVNANLYIIGKGHSSEWSKVEGIHVKGYVEDITSFFESCSLFCFIGRGHPISMAVLEALCAGLPTVVGNYTGSAEVIKKLDENLISKLDAKDVADKIISYFNLPRKSKEELSKKSKELGKKFNRKERCKEFKKQFELLLGEIT